MNCISVCLKTYTFHTANTLVVYFLTVQSERKMFKVNLHHNTMTCYRNTSLLKHGFRVKACLWLQKMLKLSTLPFHATTAGDRLLERSFLLPVWVRLFTTISHGTPSHSCCEMPICRLGFSYGPCMTALRHIFFSLFGYSRRTCFRKMCSTGWTNSMACLFLWLHSLTFWSLGTSEMYCLCHRCQWRSGLGTSQYGFEMIRKSWSFMACDSRCSDAQRPARKLSVDTSRNLLQSSGGCKYENHVP